MQEGEGKDKDDDEDDEREVMNSADVSVRGACGF